MQENCSICNRYGDLDRDHIKTKGSGGPDDDYNIWLICRLCHIDKHGKGLSWIINKYPHTKDILKSKGWEVIGEFGRKRLKRIMD